MQIRKLVFNVFHENTYIVCKEDGRCVVIDPGMYHDEEIAEFFDTLDSLSLKVEAVLVTHAHFDHVAGVKPIFDKYKCKIYLQSEDKVVMNTEAKMLARLQVEYPAKDFPTVDIKEGDIIQEAGMTFKVILTPGHSPGGACYFAEEDKVLFTGDTLFAGTIGRTDFSYGDYDKEISSIMEKLLILDPETQIWPGHGHDSTIGHERTNNPFLEPFNEPEEEIDPDLPGISLTRE